MGLFGNIISIPVRAVNTPIRVVETLAGAEQEDERFMSKPLDILAKELSKLDEEEDE